LSFYHTLGAGRPVPFERGLNRGRGNRRCAADANPGSDVRAIFAPNIVPRRGERATNPAKSLVGRQGLEPWTLGLKERASEFA